MANKCRDEIVGKRFLSIRSSGKLKVSKISEWEWRSGVVRSVSGKDSTCQDFSALVEFDDIDWQRREWVRIHDIFQVFLVEHTLVWAQREDPENSRQPIVWPALNFRAIVDKVGYHSSKRIPLEFLGDKYLGLVEDKSLECYQEDENSHHLTITKYPSVGQAIKDWLDYQDGQKIILTTPTVLVGYRIEVYRAEGTTQWYTAVIQSYNHATKTLTVTDDTVLEEHNEDPTLIQMRLIDDGVVDSILRGVEVGIAPRRRPIRQVASKDKEQQQNTMPKKRNWRKSAVKKRKEPRQQIQTPIHLTDLSARLSASRKSRQKEISGGGSEILDKERSSARSRSCKDRKRKPDEQIEETKSAPSNSANSGKRARSSDRKSNVDLKSESPKCTVEKSQSDGLSTKEKVPKNKDNRQARVVKKVVPEVDKIVSEKSSEKAKKETKKVPNTESDKVTKSVESPNRSRENRVNRTSDKNSDKNKVNKNSDSGVKESKVNITSEQSDRGRVKRTSDHSERVSKTSDKSEKEEKVNNISEKSDKERVKRTEKSDRISRSSDNSEKEGKSRRTFDRSETRKSQKTDSVIDSKEKEILSNKSSGCEKSENNPGKSNSDKFSDKSSENTNSDNLKNDNDHICKLEQDTSSSEIQTDGKSVNGEKKSTEKEECSTSDSSKVTDLPENKCENSDDIDANMHLLKQRLLAGNNNSSEKLPSSQSIATSGIDVNQPVTEQIAKLARQSDKLSSSLGSSGDFKSSFSSSKSVSPAHHSFSLSSSSENVDLKESKYSNSLGEINTSSSSYSSNVIQNNPASYSDDRSSSRASEHSNSGYTSDDRSRIGDLKGSRKNSPASSPLIIDRAEPVNPYRDPELMRKNPVQSNVQSMLGPHKTTTYPNVHTPVPSAPPAAAVTSSFPTHPLSRPHVVPSIPYPHQLSLAGAASLSQLGLPPGLSQLDHATLAALQQQHQLALQYSNAQARLLQMSGYPPPTNLTMSQLEVLWQQKYPTVPVPPQWMLAQKQGDLLRDFFELKEREMERYERERIERERLEREQQRERLERIEREKIERERQLERERQERIERERIEREKSERERAERERADREEKERQDRERERHEREQQERSRLEREREQSQLRERILKESVDTNAAVDDHFNQSLRLASLRLANQKQTPQAGLWPSPALTPSITRGTGKQAMMQKGGESGSSGHQGYNQSGEKMERKFDINKCIEEKVKQEHIDRDDMRAKEAAWLDQIEQRKKEEMILRHFAEQQKLYEQQKSEKTLKAGETKPRTYPHSYKNHSLPTTTSSSSTSSLKQEPNFSLYGYQPFQHSYISSDQLKNLVTDKHKEEKMSIDSKTNLVRSSSPKRSNMSVPPPLIKDSKSHSSVIVENKGKEGMKPSSPRPAHSHYSSTVPLSSQSPRQQPKPAHTPDRHQDRPRSALSSNSPISAAHNEQSMDLSSSSGSQISSHRAAENKHISNRSQSPLHVASPHQLSAAIAHQPVDYHRGSAKSRTSPPANNSPVSNLPNTNSPTGSSGHYVSAAIAQPPVSLPPSSVAFSYSLIQQGLVPNPIYSQSTVKAAPAALNEQHKSSTSPLSGAALTTTSSHGSISAGQGVKRRNNNMNKEGSNRKRQKGGPATSNTAGAGLSIPVTTPQILTNHSPYTTSSGSAFSSVSSVMASTTSSVSVSNVVSSSMSSLSSAPSVTSSSSSFIPSGGNSLLHAGASGFMDSFKSFVENAVQNAFFQDQEFTRQKVKPQQHNPSQGQGQTTTPQQPTSQNSPQQQQNKSNEVPSIPINEDSALSLSNSSSVSSHNAALMDTINRVANGQVDTDSDTLSAPSPPPQFKSDTSSPHKSGNHPKLKKAWLQRHSDEDKELKSLPDTPEDDKSAQKEELVRNCFVNCSYISPCKEGGSKSPISALRLPNGNMKELDDESTTSASETESQVTENSAGKKRIKTKRNHANVKKSKTDSETDSSTGSKKKREKKTKETKDGSTKLAKNKEVKDENNSSKSEESNSKKDQVKESQNMAELSPVVPMEMDSCDDKSYSEKSNEKQLDKECEKQSEKQNTVENVMDKSIEKPGDNKNIDKVMEKNSDKQTDKNSDKNSEAAVSTGKTEKKKHKKNKEKETKVEQQQQQIQQQQKQPQPVFQPENRSSASFNKPLVKASTATLKKTCQSFLQEGSCSEVTPKLMKCRECKMTPTQRSKKLPNIFCRFYAFRRLRYSQKGFLTIAGFSELTDAEPDDIDPWLPRVPVMPPKISIETSKFIIAKVGDKFCELVRQEREALSWAGSDANIAWKRAVTGVREMCDVCDTTLFNMHWVCHKCGFVVCLDCYKVKMKAIRRENGEESEEEEEEVEVVEKKKDGEDSEEDQRRWLTCSSNRQQHEIDKLTLTQIIPRDALWQVGNLIHEIHAKWNIPSKCPCNHVTKLPTQKNGINQQYVQQALNHLSDKSRKKMVNGIGDLVKPLKGNKKQNDTAAINGNVKYNPDSTSPLSLLADVASMDSESSRDRSESPYSKRKGDKSYNPITEPVSPCGGGGNHDADGEKKTPGSCSTLRELLTKTAGGKVKGSSENSKKPSKSKNVTSTLDDIIQSVVERQVLPRDRENSQPIRLMHYIPRSGHSGMIAYDTPILVHNLTETSVLYPDVPHSWLCDGRLLRLHDPRHRGNLKIFQEQWKRGQPVLVSGVDKALNRNIWMPQSFSKTFGRFKNDLINTRTSCVIIGHPMSSFWDGFECFAERLVDEEQNPMLLKLKDWPPGDDFSDLMPNHFDDLMQALPLPEYTHRHGKLNLASRLPDFLVRPDLGPKMYNAYGSALFPKEGTTNLHLDVSDAVNVMVYVGIPDDGPGGRSCEENAALKAIDDAGCDIITKRRVREVHEVPGALWHIYDAMDADKIRDFLNKMGKERGEEVEDHHDAIHDQSWYLDEDLRDRLYKEYGVLGYTIVQCMGDAVFIPAGAPHQVRNFHSCIKVAEDFVSPEHLNHCFSLTQEFRHLSDTHSNHEDKLQVKNIVYHAVKDALAVLNDADPDSDD